MRDEIAPGNTLVLGEQKARVLRLHVVVDTRHPAKITQMPVELDILPPRLGRWVAWPASLWMGAAFYLLVVRSVGSRSAATATHRLAFDRATCGGMRRIRRMLRKIPPRIPIES